MNEKNHLLDDLFRKYRTLVIRNACLFVKDYYAAEDICQETFIRLGENLDKIPPENVKAWLIRVSERLAIDYMRKGGKYKTILTENGMEYEMPGIENEDLSNIMVRREEAEQKRTVLGELKKERPLWYETTVMYYLEGMDNSTIGRELGVNAGLVSKWKERARKWLWKRYDEAGEEKDG